MVFVCSSSTPTTILSDFTETQNWFDDHLVNNDDNPDALFKAKNAEKRQHHLVCVEEWQKVEKTEECRKMVEAEEHQKAAEVHYKAEEKAKHKAAEEVAKKRVSVLMFPDKRC